MKHVQGDFLFTGEAASQISLVSPVGYSPNKPSALIIEADEQGKKRYDNSRFGICYAVSP